MTGQPLIVDNCLKAQGKMVIRGITTDAFGALERTDYNAQYSPRTFSAFSSSTSYDDTAKLWAVSRQLLVPFDELSCGYIMC